MFTSTIVLPAESQGAEQDRLSSAIAHELAHLKRRDALWILLAELVKAAFWFVPFAWIACREQRVEAEIAADELARSWTASSPKNYASHLLAWVDTNRIPSVSVDAAPGVLLATHELTRRMKAMSFKPYNHQSTVACVAVLAVPLVLGLAPVKLVSVLGQKLAWSQYHGDPQNTGRGPGSGASGVKAWTFATHGWIDCSPAIGPDGTIYAGSEDGNEYAIDSKTGQEKWAFLTGDRTVAAPAENGGSVTGAAAIGADGTVYVASQDQSLYALNPKTGAKKWSFQTGGYIASGPAIGTDGSLIFGSQTGIVYALNGKTGAQKWTFTTSSEVYTTPAVGIDGTVYVGSSDKRLYALNGVTGKQNWSFQGEDKMGSPAVGADGTVYVSGGNNLYAVDGTNGNLKWTAHCSGKVDDPTIASDGTIYVGAGKEVIALNSADGAKKWSFAAGDVVNSPTIASDGTIYVGSSDRNLYALDGTTGAKKWSVTLADKVLNSPSISPSGTIYVGCADLRLYAIR
jgi:outer membrane protein assembly factor BamB